MSGLNRKRLVWTILFLGVTLAAIVMEVVAGIFHPAGTIPWTEYLARYVPWPVQLAAYVILAVWLPFHFWRHDHLRKVAYRNGVVDGHLEAAVHGTAAARARCIRDIAETLRQQTAVSPELLPGYRAAADWLDPQRTPTEQI